MDLQAKKKIKAYKTHVLETYKKDPRQEEFERASQLRHQYHLDLVKKQDEALKRKKL
jgi:hypothetical protein